MPKLSLVVLVSALVSLAISGPVSDRIGRRKPLVIAAALLMGVGMAIPFLVPTVGGMFLYAGIAGFGFGAYLAVDAALMSELLPSKDTYAKDLGVLNIAATLPPVDRPVHRQLHRRDVRLRPDLPARPRARGRRRAVHPSDQVGALRS